MGRRGRGQTKPRLCFKKHLGFFAGGNGGGSTKLDNYLLGFETHLSYLGEEGQTKLESLSGMGDSQLRPPPIFIVCQADSHESLQFPIRANHLIRANRANRFARITPLRLGTIFTHFLRRRNRGSLAIFLEPPLTLRRENQYLYFGRFFPCTPGPFCCSTGLFMYHSRRAGPVLQEFGLVLRVGVRHSTSVLRPLPWG